MEDFERIKKFTEQAIQDNIDNTKIIKDWKKRVRVCLMKVRQEFLENIDKFIELFGDKFKDVEMSQELLEFRGEDRKLSSMVEDLQKKHTEITNIFN